MKRLTITCVLTLFTVSLTISSARAELPPTEKILVKEFKGPKELWGRYISGGVVAKLQYLGYKVVSNPPADITVEGEFSVRDIGFMEEFLYVSSATYVARNANGELVAQGKVEQSEDVAQKDEQEFSGDAGKDIAVKLDLKIREINFKARKEGTG